MCCSRLSVALLSRRQTSRIFACGEKNKKTTPHCSTQSASLRPTQTVARTLFSARIDNGGPGPPGSTGIRKQEALAVQMFSLLVGADHGESKFTESSFSPGPDSQSSISGLLATSGLGTRPLLCLQAETSGLAMRPALLGHPLDPNRTSARSASALKGCNISRLGARRALRSLEPARGGLSRVIRCVSKVAGGSFGWMQDV